jgi:lipoprotein signal peptidase
VTDPDTNHPDQTAQTAPEEPVADPGDAGQPIVSRLAARWVFWLMLVLVLLFDLSTKTWAESHLTYPVIFTKVDEKTVRHRPWTPNQLEEAQAGNARRLPAASKPDDSPVVPMDAISSDRPKSGAAVDGGLIKLRHDVLRHGEEGDEFIPGVLHFKYAENYGAAFSIGSESGHLLTIISIGILGLLFFYTVRTPRRARFTLLCLGLVAGGALGNIHDRLWHKTVDDRSHFRSDDGWEMNPNYGTATTSVRDFLYWPFDIPLYSTVGLAEGQPTRKWPIFNIADVGIMSGVIGLIIVISFSPNKPRRRPEDPA